MSGGVAFMGFCADTLPDCEGWASEDLPGLTAFQTESIYLVTGMSPKLPK